MQLKNPNRQESVSEEQAAIFDMGAEYLRAIIGCDLASASTEQKVQHIPHAARVLYALAAEEPSDHVYVRPKLSPRRMEILKMLADGLEPERISKELHLSIRTIRNHINIICKTFSVHSYEDAVRYARRVGLV